MPHDPDETPSTRQPGPARPFSGRRAVLTAAAVSAVALHAKAQPDRLAVASPAGPRGWFPNVQSLIAAAPHFDGPFADTQGYTRPGDGGGATYQRSTAPAHPPGSIVDASGAAWAIVNSGQLNVRQFGAVGDGIADDTRALNEAFAFVRHGMRAVQHTLVQTTMSMGSGVYRITGSIDMTDLRAVNATIIGDGAVILAQTAGRPALDMLASRFVHLSDITIVGDQDSPPSYGIQIGRTRKIGSSAGDHCFDNVRFDGFFDKSCFYNFGGETVIWTHCKLYNRSAKGSCLIEDTENALGITSQFIKQENASPAQYSCNENVFVNCDFRKIECSGHAIEIIGSNLNKSTFLASYAACIDNSIIVVRDCIVIRDIELDLHCEVATIDSILNVMMPDGKGDVYIQSLRFRDQDPEVVSALFKTTGGEGRLHLIDADLRCGLPSHDCKIFSDNAGVANRATLTGNIHWPSNRPLDLSNFILQGTVFTGGQTQIKPGLGSYRIIRASDAATPSPDVFKGEVVVMGTPQSAAIETWWSIAGGDQTTGAVLSANAAGDRARAVISAKGAAPVSIVSNAATGLQVINAPDCRNYAEVSGGPRNGAVQLGVNGLDEHVSLALAAKGNGMVDARAPLKLMGAAASALPDAKSFDGCLIRVSDRNSRLAISDGQAWRFADNGRIVG